MCCVFRCPEYMPALCTIEVKEGGIFSYENFIKVFHDITVAACCDHRLCTMSGSANIFAIFCAEHNCGEFVWVV